MMGAVVTGRPVESAWLLHSEKRRTVRGTPMLKGTWKIGFISRKVTIYKESRQVQQISELLSNFITTQLLGNKS